jgi:hypothetical protein
MFTYLQRGHTTAELYQQPCNTLKSTQLPSEDVLTDLLENDGGLSASTALHGHMRVVALVWRVHAPPTSGHFGLDNPGMGRQPHT